MKFLRNLKKNINFLRKMLKSNKILKKFEEKYTFLIKILKKKKV